MKRSKNKCLCSILLLGTILTNSLLAQGQKTEPVKPADSASVAKMSSQLDSVLSLLKAAKNDEKEKDVTGYFSFDTLSVPVYTANEKFAGFSIKIDSVTLLIDDGYALDIKVYAGRRVFTNTKAPVVVSDRWFTMTRKTTDKLQNERNADEFIMLQECVFYNPVNRFFPDDSRTALTRANPKVAVARGTGINTVVDLRIYTDALGSLGDEPNGIILTDIRMKQYIFKGHFRDNSFRILNYLTTNITAAKFDSKNKAVDSGTLSPTTALMQRAKFKAEIGLNILSLSIFKKTPNICYLDAGAGFANIDWARKQLKDTITVKTQHVYFEGGGNFRNGSNSGVNFFARLIWLYVPFLDIKPAGIFRPGFLRLGVEAYWNPSGNPSGRLFGRIQYTKGFTSIENRNAFAQVQLGYSVLLAKLIK